MNMSIMGMGCISALGAGIECLKAGMDGSIKPRIETEVFGNMSLPVYRAHGLEKLDKFVHKKTLRRIDCFSRMALLSSLMAADDSGIELEDKSRVGIVFGSGHGCAKTTFDFLDSAIDNGDSCASPTYFATSVHNSLTSLVSIQMGINGPVQMLSAFRHTVASVFIAARALLDSGSVDYVIAGAGDEYCDVLGYAAASKGAGKCNEIEPFNFDKCSFLPGEGFCSFLLGRENGKYGTVQDVLVSQDAKSASSILADAPSVVVSAQGDKEEGQAYRKLEFEQSKAFAYSHLRGAFPAGSVFDIAAGALSDNSTVCVEYSGRGKFNLFKLEKSEGLC